LSDLLKKKCLFKKIQLQTTSLSNSFCIRRSVNSFYPNST